jgi:hypothetical protein
VACLGHVGREGNGANAELGPFGLEAVVKVEAHELVVGGGAQEIGGLAVCAGCLHKLW